MLRDITAGDTEPKRALVQKAQLYHTLAIDTKQVNNGSGTTVSIPWF